MDRINILIVEDEPLIAKDLAFMLQDLDYEIAGIAYNAKDALTIVKNNSVDLAILDISIEGDVNGIKLASKLEGIPFIYLTSHSSREVVEEAKKTGPLAYLVKPIDERDLLSTIDVAFYNFQQKQILPTHLSNSSVNSDLFVKSGHSYIKVNTNEILFAEANDNYCFIHTKDKKFLLSQTLKVIEEKLSPFNFLRIHRSYLINIGKVEKFTETTVFINQNELPIGRRQKKVFKSHFNLL